MTTDINKLNDEWQEKSHLASGHKIVEFFGEAAMESWDGAEALIDAYLDMEEKTGECSYRIHINELMYLTIKGYWSDKLGIDKLEKLDNFLSKF